jgi:hypothetical protein
MFDEFWNDPRIPKRMKRCGPGPVRKALAKRSPDEWEAILTSLPLYERHKDDYADFCHLSTYINQERDKVEWEDIGGSSNRTDWWDARREEEEIKRLIHSKLEVVK